MRIFVVACLLWGSCWLGHTLWPESYWHLSTLSITSAQEMRVRMPQELKTLSWEDDGWVVKQARGDNFFVDVHMKDGSSDDIHFMNTPPISLYKEILEKYKLREVEWVYGVEVQEVEGIDVYPFRFKGKKDGQDYEAIAAAYEAQGKVCVMTYIYHAGSEKAYDEVMGSIRSLEFRDRD